MTSRAVLSLADRLCRPQRLGLFGHRGVGKTTLMTMLYREAVGGRLPDLRLAAGDAGTADYLADKIVQLEAGNVLPGTLGETELRFQLHQGDTRLELIVKDYQGEHVAVGRSEPIREFLLDCDAVWLCFDPALLQSRPDRLQGEQEAEQIIEDHLALDRHDCPHRPMALVITKSDLLPPKPEGIGEELWLSDLTRDTFGMTLHALKMHAPGSAVFAVSSLGRDRGTLMPVNLDRPLRWLLDVLQVQDEARLDRLFQLAPGRAGLLEKCVRAHALRWPDSPRRAEFAKRLVAAKRRRRLTIAGGILAGVACLLFVLWGYDRLDRSATRDFEQNNDDLPAVRERWERYSSSPLNLFARAESRGKVQELSERIREQKRAQGLADLHVMADDPATATTTVKNRLKEFVDEFPDTADLDGVRESINRKIHDQRESEAREALNQLIRSERLGTATPRKHLEELVVQADRVLSEFKDTGILDEVGKRRELYFQRLDEHDFEAARAYARQNTTSYDTQQKQYRLYLSRHPKGAFVAEARRAIADIERTWDRRDFREIRDQYLKDPAAFDVLRKLCDEYLAVHGDGKYREEAKELRAWIARVRGPREYTVTVVKGDFPVEIGRWFTKGPKLSVEIEVAGVRHGPSNIVKNNYDPEWDHEFQRPITWKPGDSVRIIVRDHNYTSKNIIDYESSEGDKLAMRHLNGKFELGKSAVWFKSDFNMPKLPEVD